MSNDSSIRGRRLALVALFSSVAVFGISFGGLVPWIALSLEDRGTGVVLIGLVSAANPLGVMLAAPFVPALVARFGVADTIIASFLLSLLTLGLLPLFDSTGAWLTLRLLNGLAGSAPWVVTETWINVIAGDRRRGRIIGLYGAVLAAGFAAGPLVLGLFGTGGLAPFAAFFALHVVAILPIFLVRRLAPRLSFDGGGGGLVAMLLAMPVLLAGAFLSGAVDTAFFSFLPIWGRRSGLGKDYALLLLSIFIAGNVLLQYPLGWLADRGGYRRVMIGCGLCAVAGPLLTLQSLGSPWLLGIVMFLWGGTAWGAYSIALAALGARFAGGALAAANAAFVMVYTLANITGPALAGLAMEVWGPHGLMYLMLVLGLAFTLLVVARSLSQGSRS